MGVCDKAVDEQTASEIFGCGWNVIKSSVGSVIDHPGGANVTEWMLTILAIVILLFLFGSVFRR